MKLKTVSLVSHSLAAVSAAVITGLAVFWGGLAGLAVGVLVGLLVSGAAAVFAASRLGSAVEGLRDALSPRRGETVARCGIVEIDEMISILSDYERRVSSSTSRAQEQMQEVQKLLGQLDRREKPTSRSPWVRDADREQSAGRRLRDVLTSMVRAADGDLKRVLSLSSEIEQNTKAMADGASDQTEAVSKTTTYVEQMSANIDLVTQNADAANQAADAVRDCSSEAQRIMQELTDGMDRIRRHVEASWRKLRALGDRTQEIGSIVETIAGIAARTDMLALNASIESVRAGEHGRGFAVVADEVRKLAEQAAQATKEVGGLIETVQLETQESVSVMAQEHAEVEAEVERVNSAGESLERISRTSSDSANRVGEISRVTKQQLRFTQEVVLAMERISEAARGIRGRAEGVSWTTNTLSELVRQLDSSLSPLRGCIEHQSDRNSEPETDSADHEADANPNTTAEGILRQATELAGFARGEPDDAALQHTGAESGARTE